MSDDNDSGRRAYETPAIGEGSRKHGRPGRYCYRIHDKIVALIGKGLSRESAANGCGVTATTLYEWMQTYPDFLEDIKKADAELEAKLIGNIARAARRPATWQAGAWLLERKKPQRWGRNAMPEKEPEQPEDLVMGLDAGVDGRDSVVIVVKPGASLEDIRKAVGLDNPEPDTKDDHVAPAES